MNKIFLVFMFLLMISSVSAILEVSREIDVVNGKEYRFDEKVIEYNKIWDTYKPIEVKTNWDLPLISETKLSAYIEEHQFECEQFCESIFVLNQKEERVLIEDIRFYTIEGKDKYLQPVRSYQISIWDNPLSKTETYFEDVCSGGTYDEEGNELTKDVCEKVERTKEVYYKTVQDFKTECNPTGEISKNGTAITNCKQVQSGTHEVEYNGYSDYQIGTTLPAGTYKVKLSAEKRPERIVDWQIKAFAWFDSWAVWGISDMTSNLVAQYKLNTNSNQTAVTDTTGNNNGVLVGKTFNNGNVSGGVTIEDGAMKFDGVNGFVDMGDVLNFGTSDFTISAWVNSNNVSATTAVAQKKGDVGSATSAGWGILLLNNQYRMTISNGSVAYGNSNTGSISNNVDYLMTIKREGTNFSRYVNGILAGSVLVIPSGFNITNNARNLQIGRDSTGRYLNGSASLIIHNKAISDSQILEIVNAGKDAYSPVTTGLVAQYSGRDYLGTTATPTTILDTNQLSNGKINQAFNFDGVNDYVNVTSKTYSGNQTYSAWVYNLNNRSSIFGFKSSNVNQFIRYNGNAIIFEGNTNNDACYSSAALNNNQWYHIVVMITPTGTNNCSVYVNGILSARIDDSITNTNITIDSIGISGDGSAIYHNGSIDDVRIYNRSLTSSEISYIYNSGAGTEYNPNAFVTLTSPSDNAIAYTNPVNLSASADIVGGAYAINATLYDNSSGTWTAKNTTNLSAIGTIGLVSYYNLDEQSGTTMIDTMGKTNGTIDGAKLNGTGKINKAYLFDGSNDKVGLGNYSFIDGAAAATIGFWYNSTNAGTYRTIMGRDNYGGGTNRFFVSTYSDRNNLYMQMGSPECHTTTSPIIDGIYQYVMWVYNGSGSTDADKLKLYINGTSVALTCTSALPATIPTASYDFTIGAAANGGSSWWAGTLDEISIWNKTLSTTEIAAMYNAGAGTRPSSSANSNTISFLNTYPSGTNLLWNMQFCDSDGACGFATANRTFSMDSQAPTINILSGNGTQDYGTTSINHTINFSVTDTNLDKCWVQYNSTNRTASCTSGVETLANFTLQTGLYSAIVWANDSLGNIRGQNISWDYLFFQSNVSYNPTALETSSQTFRLSGEKATSVTSISARLFYDGSARVSTVTSSGNNVNITNIFEIPQGSSSRDLFWEVTMVTTNGTVIINTTTQTQIVNNITFSICTVPTGLSLNFTTYDTSTNLPMNSTFEATFSYYAEGGSGDVLAEYNYQNLTENRSNYLFCLNSSGINVTLDAFVSYAATGYDRREYIINDGTIGNFTVTIPLFLTQTILTDVVTFTLEDQNYDPIPDALVTVQKWNVGTNTYSTIGMFETTSAGQGIMDLELYNTWYRVIVTLDGQIIYTSGVQKVASTEWNILINLEVQNPYDLFGTISKGLTYDNTTQIVTYTWADSSGYTNNGCLIVNKLTPTGHTAIYSTCVETVAGSINYQLVQNGTYEIYGIIYLTAEYDGISQISDVLYIQIGEDELTTTVAPYGKVISLLAVGTSGFIGIAAGSPILGAVLLILSLVGVSLAGWLSIGVSVIWGLITVLIVILARQTRRSG